MLKVYVNLQNPNLGVQGACPHDHQKFILQLSVFLWMNFVCLWAHCHPSYIQKQEPFSILNSITQHSNITSMTCPNANESCNPSKLAIIKSSGDKTGLAERMKNLNKQLSGKGAEHLLILGSEFLPSMTKDYEQCMEQPCMNHLLHNSCPMCKYRFTWMMHPLHHTNKFQKKSCHMWYKN